MTPMAPMGGGTQLSEGAHLTGGIRTFVANQANVAVMHFLDALASLAFKLRVSE